MEMKQTSSGFYVIDDVEFRIPCPRPFHLERRLRNRKRLSHRAEANRLAIINARKHKLAKKSSHVQAVVQKHKARIYRELSNKEVRISETLKTAEENRRLLLEKQVRKNAAYVKRAKEIAHKHQRKQDEKTEELRVEIDMKLKMSTIRRQKLLKVPRSRLFDDHHSELDFELASVPDEAAIVIQSWWRHMKFAQVIRVFRKLGLSIESVKAMSFEQLARILQNQTAMKITSALLQKAKRASTIPYKFKAPSRVFLSAYMIVSNPEVIFQQVGQKEKDLSENAHKALFDLQAWMDGFRTDRGHALLRDFTDAWEAYHLAFEEWKTKDSSKLVAELEEHFIDLEKLWQSVKDQMDAEEQWAPRIASQQNRIRNEIMRLGGADAITALDEKVKETIMAIEAVVEAEASEQPTTKEERSRRTVKSTSASDISKMLSTKKQAEASASKAAAANKPAIDVNAALNQHAAQLGISNIQIAHELVLDPDFELKHSAEGENQGQDLESRVRAMAKKAFFDGLGAEFSSGNMKSLPMLFSDIQEQLRSMVSEKNAIAKLIHEGLDIELIKQQVDNKSFDIRAKLLFVLNVMKQLCAPVRDGDIRALEANVKESNDVSQLALALQKLFGILEMMKLDLANFRLSTIKPHLKENIVEYEREKFDASVKSGEISLVNTKKWLAAATEKASQTAAERNPENIDIPENKVKYDDIYYDGLLEFLSSSTPVTHPEILPETFHLDRKRLWEIQNEVQAVTVAASLSMMTRNTVSQYRLDPSVLHRLALQLLVLLRDPSTKLDNIKAFITTFMNKHIEKKALAALQTRRTSEPVRGPEPEKPTLPVAIEPEQEAFIHNMVEKTLSSKDTVYQLIQRRVLHTMKLHLSSGRFRTETLPRHGLDVVEKDLLKLSERVYRLAQHNREVYASYYDKIIKEKLEELEKKH